MRLIVAAALWTVAASAAGQDAHRVFDPPRVPDDARLSTVHHVDRPFPFRASFDGLPAWERRAEELRVQVKLSQGIWPTPERTPLDPVVHGKIDRDEYTIEKVFFRSVPGHYVCGNLYRPKGKAGKLPGVLCPHGHWSRGRFYERKEEEGKKEIASGAEKTLEGARYPLQARCAMLARLGCVVFHYDMVGNADSTFIPHRAGFSDAEAEMRLQSSMGLQTWNSVRALDFLSSLPDVDPARIGVTGASGGGTQTFMLGAVDSRPTLSVPAVMVSVEMQGGCICENASYLRVGTDNIELSALFAPKAQALIAADDWTRRVETHGLPDLKKVYALYGAEDRVAAKYFPFPHNYNQVSREMMYAWANVHLKLGHEGTIAEKPFVPVPPAELSVFDAAHPKPADAKDAAGVRRAMTEASDRQMDALAEKGDDYRRVVGAALRTLILAEPAPRLVPDQATKTEVRKDGYVLHKGLWVDATRGVRLPAVRLVPEGWQGTVVVWAHPEGKRGLFGPDGEPAAATRELLKRGWAVVSADLFLTGEFHLPERPTPAPWIDQKYHKDIPFAGYTFGYNAPPLARRASDLLAVVRAVRGGERVKAVHLVGSGKSGTAALLARALAGDDLVHAAIDLDGFEFDQVKEFRDERMLPGALKYGGVFGFAALVGSGRTALFNPAAGGKRERVKLARGVTVEDAKPGPDGLVKALLKGD